VNVDKSCGVIGDFSDLRDGEMQELLMFS